MLRTTVDRRNMHVTDVMCDDRKTRITTITHALRPQWECYLTKQTHGVRAKVTVGNCGNGESREVQAWCTRHLVAGVIHSFPTPSACPPAIGPRTPLNTRGRWVIPIWLQFIYDWWLLKLSATVLDDWSCLMQPRRVVYTHTHTSWRHQAASVVWASPGVERRDAWQINCWYRISHSALRLIRS